MERAGPMATCSSSTSASSITPSACSVGEARPTILDKLRCPQQSTLGRKRKSGRNETSQGKRTASGRGAVNPKSLAPRQRVTEFPNEKLCVSNRKLFCLARHEEIALKHSVVSYRVKSAKHMEGKRKLARKEGST